jgi:succinyl-diaminopimelate desuccinylase
VSEHLRQRLAEAIAARRDELVALTRALVAIPTVNPPGAHYREACDLIGGRMERQGWQVTHLRATGTPGDGDAFPRWNVVARREGGRPGPCVHFNGHIDVVEPGHGWTRDPFGGAIEGDRLYGRGTADMKGGLAAAIIACEALIDLGLDLPGALEISGTADEESGGYGGVAWLAERGLFSPPRVDHVIIPEPLGVDRVCIGHRGVWWAQVETHGRIAHGSMPFLGESAIAHMGALLAALESELLPRLAGRTTAMPVVPEGARASTLNLNSVHGGQCEPEGGALPSPCVADSCRLVIDRRLLAEETIEGAQAEVEALLARLEAGRPGFRATLTTLFAVPPVMADPAGPVVTACAQAIERLTGRPAALVASPGTYDQKHIDRIGRLHDCIAYGPGRLELAHQPDEYVEIPAMVASAQVMAETALDLLTRAR